VAWLDASDQMWSEQLAAFQRHLDDETGEGGR
jgi:hypothetical protein